MSQYEATLRAILDWPIPAASLEADRAAIMLNILGTDTPAGHLEVRSEAAKIPRAQIHMYGKGDINGRPGRKMGHVTITAVGSPNQCVITRRWVSHCGSRCI